MSTTQPQPQQRDPAQHHAGGGIFIALVPWILFTLLAQHSTLKLGAGLALVAAVVIAAPGVRSGRPKTLELAAVATFAAFTVVAFFVDADTAHWLSRYGRAIAAALLAAIAFGSLLATPFTAQYARERVPQRYWDSPQFVETNRRLTTMWGGVFAAMVVCHVIAGTIDTLGGNVVFNWVIPIALVLQAAKRSTLHGAVHQPVGA